MVGAPSSTQGPNHKSSVTCRPNGNTLVRKGRESRAGEGSLLTISHEDDDMAGTVPAFKGPIRWPAHHVVYFLEGLLGVSPSLMLVICGKGRNHLAWSSKSSVNPRGLSTTEIPHLSAF